MLWVSHLSFFCTIVVASQIPPPLSDGVAAEFKRGLQAQQLHALEVLGQSVTVMAVGEAGVGKSTLFANLFLRELSLDGGSKGPTLSITEHAVSFDLDGVAFTARLVDCPGYGDALDLGRTFALATRYLDGCFARALRQERKRTRDANYVARAEPDCVDVILYFFAPHRCKGADLAFLRKLRGRASIVPILAKADTMTSEELSTFRAEVTAALAEADVPTVHEPFALICSNAFGDRKSLGRRYPWGVALSEEGPIDHSELPKLRRFLLIDGLLSLKQQTRKNYENYRRNALWSSQVGLLPFLRGLLPPAPLALASLLVPQVRAWAAAKLALSLARAKGIRAKGIRATLRAPPPPPHVPPPPPRRLFPWD